MNTPTLEDDIREWKERVVEELFVNQSIVAGELILEELINSVEKKAIATTLDKIEAVWDRDGMEELSYKTFSTLKQELAPHKEKL